MHILNHQDYFLLSTQDHPGGEASLELNNSTDAIASIYSMEDVAKRIIAMSSDPYFIVDPNRGNPVIVLHSDRVLCEKIICFLRLSENEVRELSERYKFHPLVRISINAFLDEDLFGFDEYHFDVVTNGLVRGYSAGMNNYCSRLNKAVSGLRKVSSIEGGDLSRNFVRGAQQNLKSLKELFNNLLAIRSKILAVRVDLLYRDAFGVEELGSEKIYQQVRSDRENFIAEIRKIYCDGLMGYAWKLEYGRGRGYHYHTVFFFDGALHQQDIKIGMQLGNIWSKQTESRGTFHNCNAYKEQYLICGVGMLTHSTPDLSERFDAMANYLTKSDFHGRLRLPGRQRSFQTSFCKKKKGTRGRPRLNSNAT